MKNKIKLKPIIKFNFNIETDVSLNFDVTKEKKKKNDIIIINNGKNSRKNNKHLF